MGMNELGWIGLAFVGGMVLGGLYFGGLWWTVRQLPTVRSPGLLILLSFLVRSVVLIVGLILVSRGEALAIAAAMVGFIVMRVIIVRRQSAELRHAPES